MRRFSVRIRPLLMLVAANAVAGGGQDFNASDCGWVDRGRTMIFPIVKGSKLCDAAIEL